MGELPEEDSPPEDSPTITSSLTSLTIGEHLSKKLRLSCFHAAGADSIRAELGKPMERDIMAFYNEAIRRLPVADMPELVDCVLTGGHCIGLLDPVSNIIFNALNLRCRRMCSGDSAQPRSGRKKREGKKKMPSLSSKGAAGRGEVEESYRWATIVFRSYFGLIAFVQTYFRYLSTGQALRYLRVAGADLAVAVQLGEHQHFGLEGRQTPDLCCGRTQYALKAAAAKAEHPEPNDLAQLAKSLTPFKDQKPVAAVLQKGRLLSVEDVNGILGSRSGCTTLPLLLSKSPSRAVLILILISSLPSSPVSLVKITLPMWLSRAMMDQYLASVTCALRMRRSKCQTSARRCTPASRSRARRRTNSHSKKHTRSLGHDGFRAANY
ncbi:uncharacterized protein C2845_PM07G19630 [Panicum miliaceum]|uniref:PIR2-like helical domain-containing protein n=1 Tax=Panicum miliaceum TaxID=4540 RepID=A0A3L6SLH6_PANMI|nr:uncharacterized protein C2845_PM07G19630 [Panicum miliaceum]